MRSFVTLLFASFMVVGCSSDNAIDVTVLEAGNPAEVYGQVTSVEADATSGDALNFGITPWTEPAKLKAMYAPLISYLKERLGKNVRFVVAADYNTLLSDLKTGIIDIAAFTPGSYADALESDAGAMIYVATAQRKGKEHYRGYIVTHKESKIDSLKDAKGRRFGFVEKGSSSGYKYPLAMFLKKKINPFKYFKKVYFLGSHPNVTKAVVDGKVELGATWDGHADSQIEDGADLKVLLKTDPIPYDAIVVSKARGFKLAKEVRSALVDVDEDTKTKDGQPVISDKDEFPYSGWVVKSPAFYDIIRYTSKTIKKFKP